MFSEETSDEPADGTVGKEMPSVYNYPFYPKHIQGSYETTRETEKEALAAYSDIFLNLT